MKAAMFRNMGKTLIILREMRGRSQANVARSAGVGKSQLSGYEKGKTYPTFDVLERLLEALGVGCLDFFSTLEMVNRRLESLEAEKCDDPLQWMYPESQSTLPEGVLSNTTQGLFVGLLMGVTKLHASVVGDVIQGRVGTRQGNPCSQP
jgi:transcriptional regulator with XRE-family HTH domain